MNRAMRVWQRTKQFLAAVPSWGNWRSGLLGRLTQEAHPGDWQRNVVTASKEDLLAFSATYTCVSLIADDISKLPPLLERLVNGIWLPLTDKTSPYYRLLRKPNGYQSPIQFFSLWMVCKLLYGNVYVFLERDARRVVTNMYILDPRSVTVLVADTGDVFYRLLTDYLSGVPQPVTIPASEIIHDRMLCLWHPLVGVPPIIACGTSTTQGLKIQANSAKFFENMSRPSGHLTAEGEIGDVTAKRLKDEFERNFSQGNLGRLLVTGDGLKYEPFTIPPEQAQLIEQLKWTVEDVARCFKIPPYKLGLSGTTPALNTIGALNQEYYSQCLQIHIESIEELLDLGLALPDDISVELDEEALLRMDPLSRAERNYKEIGSGMLAPNEARAREDLPPVRGGDTPYMQQQNYSLAALDRRDSQADPFAKPGQQPTPAPATPMPDTPDTPMPEDDEEDLAAVEELATSLIAKLYNETQHANT